MRFSIAVSVLAFGLFHSVIAVPFQRRQCQATLNIALDRAGSLQAHFYLPDKGVYTNSWNWRDANAVEDLHNLMLAANNDAFSSVSRTAEIAKLALAGDATNWVGYIGESNDDPQWIILALWKISDYVGSRGGNTAPYTSAARKIYGLVEGQWDDVCDGGLWWSKAHTYKNAITNQLWLYVSASGFNRFHDQRFLDNANKAWGWLKASGMRNERGLWNDGLNKECKNNGQTEWTYNQGVIASGLSALYAARGSNDASLLDEAEITLDATMKYMTQNGILKESCDNAVSSGCNFDQQLFKGVWMKHVQYYLDNANSAGRTAKYSPFLGAQQSAIFHYGTNGNGDIGNVWYTGSQGGSTFTAQTTTSGVAGLVAAAKYAPC